LNFKQTESESWGCDNKDDTNNDGADKRSQQYFSNVFSYYCHQNLVNFNEDISLWNVVHGTTFEKMFAANLDIFSWVANTNSSEMFALCSLFRLDVSCWNVAKATELLFHLDVSGWNLAKASVVTGTFACCRNFHGHKISGLWNRTNCFH
jgi:Mycoplasma protein of unknown function, DUF285